MDWKTQNPTFQVPSSVVPDDDRPPFRIRAFTLDSYEAIKKRERKKRERKKRERKKSDRREQINPEQRSSVWRNEDTGASAWAVIMPEMAQMDARPHDAISPTHSGGSGTEPLVIQDSGGTQEDSGLRNRLSLPVTAPISLPEDLFSGEIQCLTAPASPVTSPKVRGSDLEVLRGAEQEWETCHTEVFAPRAASSNDVHMITADGDDAGMFDQQPHTRTRNEIELAVENPWFPTPADSRAGGRSDPCEQLVEGRGPRSPKPMSLEPNSAPAVAATGLERLSSTYVANGALAEPLPDGPSHTVGDTRTSKPHARRARSERAGSIDCKPTPPSAWTSGQDEQLLHLREITQLNWSNIVRNFPEMTLNAVKSRYKHLNGSRMACQTVGDVPQPRIQMHIGTTYLASSIPPKSAKKCRAPSRTKSRKQYSTPRRRHVTRRAKPTKYVPSLAIAIDEDVCQRTSRCGRPIRHPFRHRSSEGYV